MHRQRLARRAFEQDSADLGQGQQGQGDGIAALAQPLGRGLQIGLHALDLAVAVRLAEQFQEGRASLIVDGIDRPIRQIAQDAGHHHIRKRGMVGQHPARA